MGSKLFSFAAAISMVLCAGMLAMWPLSHYGPLELVFRWRGFLYGVGSEQGYLNVNNRPQYRSEVEAYGLRRMELSVEVDESRRSDDGARREKALRRLKDFESKPVSLRPLVGYRVAHGAAAGWAAVLPVAWAAREAYARRVRARVGCCQACGYDLTGNRSGVCPECGRAVSDGCEAPM